MSKYRLWARRVAAGLSSLRDRAASRLAALRFNPSRYELARFTIGRALIHAGLRVMPDGRVRAELTRLLEEWSAKVRATLLAYKFMDEK